MKVKKGFLILSQLLCSVLLAGCLISGDYGQKRESKLKNSKSVTIAYAGPKEWLEGSTDYLNGVYLALDEVKEKGLITEKELELKVIDDEYSFIEGSRIAQELAQDPSVMAVVGHADANVSLPVSAIYADAGIIMVLPIDSSTPLTKQGFEKLFQMVPNDGQIGKEMVKLIESEGCKNIAVFYEDSEYGRSLATAFGEAAYGSSINIIDRTSNYKNIEEFKKTIEKWNAMEIDSVFISGDMPGVGNFIKQAKKYGIDVPMFGGGGLNVADFVEQVGKDAENVFVTDLFNPNAKREAQQIFLDKYEKKYGEKPDSWAIQGYDSLKLLAHAIRETNSTSPTVVANYLHEMEGWEGTIDKFSFAENGEKANYTLFMKKVVDGKFVYIAD